MVEGLLLGDGEVRGEEKVDRACGIGIIWRVMSTSKDAI